MQFNLNHPFVESLIENTPNATLCLDAAKNITKVNTALLESFGIAQDTLLGKPFSIFQECTGINQALNTALDSLKDQPQSVITHYQDNNADTIELEWMLYPVSDTQHQKTYILQCVTQLNYFDNAFFSNPIVKHYPCSIYAKDNQGRLINCNDYVLNMTGVNSASQIIGKTDAQLCWRDDAKKIEETDQIVMSGNKALTLEETATLQDGKQAWYISSKTPLHNKHNQVIGLLGISIDITTLKESMLATQHNAELLHIYLKNIVATIPCSVFWKDAKGCYLGCNRYVFDMAGVSSEKDILGKTDFELPWKNQGIELQKVDQHVIQSGETIQIEESIILAKDNKYHTFYSTKTPLRDFDDNIIGIVGSSIDITELKENQAALEREKEKAEIANKAKSEFLAGISHDFRTPLNAILGFSEILLMPNQFSNHEKTEFARSIQTAGNLLLHMIEDILDFTKVESGKLAHSFEPFDLKSMIEDISKMLAVEAKQKQIELIVSYRESTPYLLISDPQRIRRIITNLLNNAVKFTDQGHVLLSVELLHENNNQVELQITVEDTGIGIPDDKINTIFDRFSRAQPSYQSKYKGTGLGLAIVKELIQDLHGTISVHSTEGKGSTFYCTMPFKCQNKIANKTHWPDEYLNIPMLIIDDNPLKANALIKQIGAKYCDTITSKTFTQSTPDIKKYQIILMDFNVKHIDPLAFAENLKDQNILLICMTKPISSNEFHAIKHAGYFDYLTKPIQPTEFSRNLLRCWAEWNRQFKSEKTLLQEFQPSILLVEDDLASMKVATILLEELGCSVEHADSYQQAISKINKQYHLAFVDVGLPDKSGLDVIQAFRHGPYSTMPLIILSAHVSENDQKTFISAGADAVLSKPVNVEMLTNILAKFLLFSYNTPR